MRTASDYQALVTSWLSSKPNFEAVIGMLMQPFADAQVLLNSIPAAFDLDTCVGVQLDVVGQWAGISRSIRVPITGVYFSFDSATLGFDQGVWLGPFSPTDGVVLLDDTTYRSLVRAKIGLNAWNGQVVSMEAALAVFFTGTATLLTVIDKQDMTLQVGMAGAIPPPIIQAIVAGGYLKFKPDGVSVQYYVVSTNSTPLFGFDVENARVSGFDTGSWGVAPQL